MIMLTGSSSCEELNRSEMLEPKSATPTVGCLVCVVHIQPRNHVPDHADYTAPTRQNELDPTGDIDQEYIWPERSRSSSGNR